MSTQIEQFGYGNDMVPNAEGVQCPCPAVAAGYSPDSGDMSTTAAERYDTILREIEGHDEGTVSFDTARQAWDETILYFQEKLEEPNNLTELEQGYAEKQLETARDIAAELGWR